MTSAAKCWVVALLVLIVAGVGFIASRVPPSLGGLGGGFFLAIGAMNILFHRRIGRQVYTRGHAGPPFVAKVWDAGGEKGAQLLYLGIGIVFAVIGCVLLIDTAWRADF